jgi:amidase
MHSHRFYFRSLAFGAAILSTGTLSNCTAPYRFSHLDDDRAFIQYWPAPSETNGKLRVAVKDLIDMKGVVTTAGSEHFARTGTPAAEDADAVKEARRRGVVFVGKTNLTELALGASGLNDYFGYPKNHLNGERRLMPGGSSSGSAVAVADGKADIALGTDTAGSVRTPAACCGIFGLKTTYGLVSLKGVYPLSPKYLDTVGPMARNVPHLVEGMDMLKPGTKARYNQAVGKKPSGRSLRVARLRIKGTDPQIERAVDRALAEAGCRVIELGPDFTQAWDQATKNGQVIAVADAYTSDQHLLNEKGVTATTKIALLLGDISRDSTAYDKALRERPYWQATLRRVLRNVDFIVLPTLKNPPLQIPLWGRFATFESRVLGMQNTVAVNYAGNPAIAIPIPMEGEKVTLTSLQLIGREKSEPELLNAARVFTSKSE